MKQLITSQLMSPLSGLDLQTATRFSSPLLKRYVSAAFLAFIAPALAAGESQKQCPAWAEPNDVCPIVRGETELWSDFYSATSEDHHIAVLVAAGPSAGPALTEASSVARIYGRRYIISALGKIGFEPALEQLKEIARDSNEPDWIRADARTAISAIESRL
jgi:hypothetical protein